MSHYTHFSQAKSINYLREKKKKECWEKRSIKMVIQVFSRRLNIDKHKNNICNEKEVFRFDFDFNLFKSGPNRNFFYK